MLRARAALAALFCVVVVTLVFAGYRLYTINRDQAVEQFQTLELRAADRVAGLVENELTHAARTLRALADVSPAPPQTRPIDELLAQQQDCNKVACFTGVAVFGLDGILQRSAGQPLDLQPAALEAAVAWARDRANARRIRVIASSPQSVSIVLATPSAAAHSDDATPQGLIAAQISLDPLFARTQGGPAWPDDATLLLTGDGTVVFHSQHPEMTLANVHRRTDRCASCHDSFDYVERILATSRGIVPYRMQRVDRIAAVAPFTFEGARWIVSVQAPRDRAVGLLSAQLRDLAALLVVVALVIGAGGTIAWRRARRRIAAGAEAVRNARVEHSHAELAALNAKLERAAHEWRTAADTIDAAFIVLEPNGAIVRMNLAAAATLPDALPAWLGRPSRQLMDYAPWNVALGLVSQAAERQVVATDRVRDANGRTWDLWCRAMPSRQPPAVLVMARNVTDVVALQESLRGAETMAQLGSIVSGVAHEVRNPLFAISSLVDAWAVQSHRDPSPFVDALRSEVNRLRTLMVDLLEYGRPTKTTRQAHRLGGVIDSAVRACVHEATARRVRVVTNGSGDVEVFMDPRRLERVFINLIQNAIQHTPEDSVVRIDITAGASEPPHLEVAIRDHGAGFAPADLPRIFTPFFSRRPGGFGLGLAITERIVTEHGGRVTAANDAAGGAVMTVWLPLARASVAAAARGVELV